MNSISEAISQSGFKSIDLIILVLYLVLLVSLGLFLSRNKGGKEKSANDYFLAGNTLTWWAVGASLIAANISAEQFIGMSGTGFRDGIAIAAYEVMAIEQILGLQGLSVNLFGLTISMRMLIILCLFIIAGLYSIYGGLASVAWTDVMQVTFLVGGGLITAYVALSEMGKVFGTDALGALSRVYADLTTGTHANDVHFHLVIQESHNVNAFENVPGIAAVVGGVWLTNLGYWGFNQYIIQKGLAAKSIDEAKKGLVFAGFLKILIPFIVVLPGICAYYIMQDPQAFSSIHLAGSINRADDAYPWLIRNFTPTGIKGLSFAALAAAIISSLASMFNSTSTLFTMDIYKKYINKDAKDKTLVSVGRMVAVGALLIALVAVEPLLGGLDQAFQYIQEYSGFIYPGIIVVFGLGLLWKRASSTAAVWTAILTIPMGILFKILLPNVAFQFRAGYIFIILFTFFVIVTYLDKKYIRCELPSEADQKQMLLWAKVLGFAGVLMIIAAAVVTILGIINPGGNPDTSVIAYLNDIGFQAFFFFGVLTGSSAVWLYSNSKDTVQDVKALPINLKLFATNREYTLGTCGIVLITFLLYALLW